MVCMHVCRFVACALIISLFFFLSLSRLVPTHSLCNSISLLYLLHAQSKHRELRAAAIAVLSHTVTRVTLSDKMIAKMVESLW